MKRQFLVLVLAILLIAASAVPSVRAQGGNPAADLVVFVQGGNLWVWNVASGETELLTRNTHIEGAAISPAGGLIAVRDWSRISYDAWERTGGIGGGPMPADIIAIDYVTVQPDFPIVDQPADASFFVEGVEDNAILRSDPSWSPEGASVAWAEVQYPTFAPETNRLMVYTFATGQTQMLVNNLPAMAGVPQPLQVKWGAGGIALRNVLYDPENIAYHDQFLIYDVSGALRSEIIVSEAEGGVADYWWAAQDGTPVLMILFNDGRWEQIDPATGARGPAPAAPQLISTVDPFNSLALSFTRPASDTAGDYWQSFEWTATTPEGEVIALPVRSAPQSVALSMDGRAVAYTNGSGGLSVWQNGDVITMPGTLEVDASAPVYWAPNGWRLGAGSGQAGPLPPTGQPEDACANVVAPRLQAGMQARVIPGTSANNLRSAPGTGAGSLGQINPGEAFTVLDGPTCADGLNWYQVDFNGTQGWTAEGDAGGYWLEPVPLE